MELPPEGEGGRHYILHHLDGDHENNSLDNLALIIEKGNNTVKHDYLHKEIAAYLRER